VLGATIYDDRSSSNQWGSCNDRPCGSIHQQNMNRRGIPYGDRPRSKDAIVRFARMSLPGQMREKGSLVPQLLERFSIEMIFASLFLSVLNRGKGATSMNARNRTYRLLYDSRDYCERRYQK